MLFAILVLVGLAIVIVSLVGVFYVLQKGLNEIITGLTSIDQRLTRVEARLEKQVPHPDREA